MLNSSTLDFMQQTTNMVYSDEQLKLIASEGGACVLACAGSGKTTAMTHMIARRLLDKSIRSGRAILGVTFSKTGATEMDERLTALLGQLNIDTEVKMKTLHAFCLEFLKDIGAMRGRSVIDEFDKLKALRELGRKHTKDFKYEDAEKIAGLMTLQRGSMRTRDEFIVSLDFRSSEMTPVKYLTVYDAFLKYKTENNLIDFDDMLLLTHYKLRQSPFYGERFMARYECVMVDEAQDMSVLQYRIVFQLLGKDAVSAQEHDEHVRKTLVLIGDDDQCQPAGTQVTMYDGTPRAIEELVVGDRVLSYSSKEGVFPLSGKTVSAVSQRVVNSIICVETEDGYKSRYTGNHICYAKVHYEGNEDKSVVYLMRNAAGGYRVGYTKLFVHDNTAASFGVEDILRTERGTDLWILTVVDESSEAWLIEQECACEYGIQMASRARGYTRALLQSVYDSMGDLSERVAQCLATFGRDINYPIYSCSVSKKAYLSFSRTPFTEVRACNLIPLCMDVTIPFKPFNGRLGLRYSQVASITKQVGTFVVYGLDVDDLHNYIADSILTHNCIYQWMGSDPQGLSKAMDAYRLPLYMLSTNYRCPENILSAAARCIAHNEHSVPKSMIACKPGGKMLYYRVPGGFAMESKYVADKIRDALAAGESPGSIAVLARNGAHMSLVWLYLTCYGIKSRLFGGQSSGSGDLIKHIVQCFKVYTSAADSGGVLYALLGGGRTRSDKISELITPIDGTFHEWLEYVLSVFVPKLGICASEDNSYANAGRLWKESMREFYSSGALAGTTMECIERLYYASGKTPREFYLTVLDLYAANMGWKYQGDDTHRIFSGTLQALRQLLRNDAECVLPMLESLDKHKAPNKNYVTLSTAHSAKGREWNTVYILCDDSYAFPPAFSLEQLLNSGDSRAVKSFIEAERRLHYVAMTRAKDTLCVVGGKIPPGRYLQEALAPSESSEALSDRRLSAEVAL
jgi:DNA helicase-2/ATP-dependent DNA helicase PcrA